MKLGGNTMNKPVPKLKFTGKVKEFMSLDSHITIIDNKSVLVENCKQILECNDVLARLVTGRFIIEIWGKELFLNNYTSNTVEVRGVIESVNLVSKGKREISK